MAAVLAMGVLAGCGSRDGQSGGTGGREAGSPEITARAVAAIMLDHLGEDTSWREEADLGEDAPRGAVGARLRYGGEGDDGGDLVRLSIGPVGDVTPGCEDVEGPCEALTDDTAMSWDEEEPEEDPGIVVLQRVTGDAVIGVYLAGPVIEGDPRQQSMEPSIDTLVELMHDPRLGLTTTTDAIEAGEQVDDWHPVVVDEAAEEMVPQTPRSLAVGWVSQRGQEWDYTGPSPLRDVLGPDAIGGRVVVGADVNPVGPGTIDVLAAPEPPEWLSSCLDGYRCEDLNGVVLAWRPAEGHDLGDDPGDAWMVFVRDDGETVALHTQGTPLPADSAGAAALAGFHMWGLDLQLSPVLGMTDSREDVESNEARSSTRRH